ncbi:MAG: hypothetical protein EP326_02195 [Deltaproteobacteria bacterium]|nr:MAG: hypothetical protein EP326_02195 [Deltaproteobacteria bacterium]
MTSDKSLNYSQPDSYHFSEDSILLAKYVSRNIKICAHKVLDLGAGCGVVGIEYSKIAKNPPVEITFVEKQEVFREHLDSNLKLLPEEIVSRVFLQDVKKLNASEFDLIISNPPYYNPQKGRLSENEIQNNCRFTTMLSPYELCSSIFQHLNPVGEAWVLVGNSKEQNHSITEFIHPELEVQEFKEGVFSILRFMKLDKKRR